MKKIFKKIYIMCGTDSNNYSKEYDQNSFFLWKSSFNELIDITDLSAVWNNYITMEILEQKKRNNKTLYFSPFLKQNTPHYFFSSEVVPEAWENTDTWGGDELYILHVCRVFRIVSIQTDVKSISTATDVR